MRRARRVGHIVEARLGNTVLATGPQGEVHFLTLFIGKKTEKPSA